MQNGPDHIDWLVAQEFNQGGVGVTQRRIDSMTVEPIGDAAPRAQ